MNEELYIIYSIDLSQLFYIVFYALCYFYCPFISGNFVNPYLSCFRFCLNICQICFYFKFGRVIFVFLLFNVIVFFKQASNTFIAFIFYFFLHISDYVVYYNCYFPILDDYFISFILSWVFYRLFAYLKLSFPVLFRCIIAFY